MYTYKVVEVREKMFGGKVSGDKLEQLLNEHARDGWQLKAITTAEVKGRVGPGGVEGLLVTSSGPTTLSRRARHRRAHGRTPRLRPQIIGICRLADSTHMPDVQAIRGFCV
jgi:hypothetical protein